jgi:hypothetical protein
MLRNNGQYLDEYRTFRNISNEEAFVYFPSLCILQTMRITEDE